MKKIIAILLMAFIGKSGIAQNYNPAVWAGTVTPAPLVTGTGSVQFFVGESGNSPLNNLSQPMVLNVTLSYGVPNNPNPIAAVTGTIANKFTWLYDPATKSYQGTQNQAIAGFEAGTVQISYLVTVASTQANPQNGFNVNITPPAYTNGSNTTNDDNVSSYTYGTVGTPLPVKLSSYNASVTNCTSSINWKSATEGNFSHYQVEYSKDGVRFETISTVNSRGDNSSYSITHNPQGKAYYRLKLVDMDGRTEYSRIIVLNVNCGKGSVLVYPNPAKDLINVNITSADAKGTMATLFNAAGRIVLNKKLENGSNQLDVSRLASGVYQLKLVNNTGIENIKIVID